MLASRIGLTLLSFLVQPTLALPLASALESSSGSACLAIFLTLFSILAFLVLIKRVYMKKRLADTRSRNPIPRCSFSVDSYHRSSTSILGSVTINEKAQAGFLIGFLGSPTCETRTCTMEKGGWREHKQSSFMYQLHTESRTRQYPLLNTPGVTNKPLTSRLASLFSSESSAPPNSYATGPPSFALPAVPSKVRTNTPERRRFSLPSMNRREGRDVFPFKRHSSLQNWRSKKSDVFGTSSPSTISLRIVESKDGPEIALPFSPYTEQASLADAPASSASPSRQLSDKFTSRLSRSSVPPLPSPACSLSFTAPSNMPSLRNGTAIHISHPYALAPIQKKNASEEHKKRSSIPVQLLRPSVPDPSPRTDFQKPAISCPPLASINVSSLEIPFPPASPLSSFPSPPNSVSLPKARQRLKPCLRIRGSPAIGPSPLRTMILPESPDHELIGQMNKENVDVKERPVSVGSPYAHLGIGLPGGHARQEDDLHIYSYPKSRRRHSSVSSRCSSNQAEEDPNILLGIIRELVEETASWDSGEMFMDKNFENMIRTSKIETRGKFEEDVADSSASASRSFEGLSEGRSAEIDLALLGLDIFKNNSDTYFDENAIDDSANLVSYWEDDSASEPRETVGLAW